MEDHIQTTDAAKSKIDTREELANLLGAKIDLVAEIASNPHRFYTKFDVAKSNGTSRTITPPRRQLRSLQRILLSAIYERVRLRSCLHGGIRGKSIVTHARAHIGQKMVATLDIRKFFPSTKRDHLVPVFNAIGFDGQAAEDLLNLVTLDNGLPQGAPTSSIFANLAFARADSRFIRLCQRHRLQYSRYVDDIAVSGNREFCELRGPFIDIIKSIGFDIADEKIHFMPNGTRQVVTGLVVNDRMRPTRDFVAELKDEIRSCLKHGASIVSAADGVTIIALKNRLTGQVGHVAHVDRQLGKQLRGMLCGVDWRRTTTNTV